MQMFKSRIKRGQRARIAVALTAVAAGAGVGALNAGPAAAATGSNAAYGTILNYFHSAQRIQVSGLLAAERSGENAITPCLRRWTVAIVNQQRQHKTWSTTRYAEIIEGVYAFAGVQISFDALAPLYQSQIAIYQQVAADVPGNAAARQVTARDIQGIQAVYKLNACSAASSWRAQGYAAADAPSLRTVEAGLNYDQNGVLLYRALHFSAAQRKALDEASDAVSKRVGTYAQTLGTQAKRWAAGLAESAAA